ncbi:short-chain dehydrogenase [Crenothrix sp. D3]|nr:short-chain dehydrogenase [Crenothrix sp. D3]
MKQNIIIIGATSAIAEAVARRYAESGAQLFLVARNNDKLQLIANDLKIRGASAVQTWVMDANDNEAILPMLDAAWNAFNSYDVALIAHGTLPDQARTETDMIYALDQFCTNGDSVIACLTGLAMRFEPQGKGVIAVISSVAGDRGRASNALYGAAKAAINTYASGLRVRLFKSGVHVLLIKPGFVATPMTAKLDLPARLTVTADKVATDIQKAINKRKNVLYTPWFWQWIMLIIRTIPEFLFKKMKL